MHTIANTQQFATMHAIADTQQTATMQAIADTQQFATSLKSVLKSDKGPPPYAFPSPMTDWKGRRRNVPNCL